MTIPTDARHPKFLLTLAVAALLVPAGQKIARAQDAIPAKKPLPRVIEPSTFASPERAHPLQLIAPLPPEEVRARTLEWVAERASGNKALVEEIGRLWGLGGEPLLPEQLFELAIRSFALADAETALFVQLCALERPALLAPEARLLEQADAGPFYLANLGCFYGRYLVQRQMFEEGLAVLEPLSIAELVDPAGYLFHKAVCQHHLLLKDDGLGTIDQLLNSTEGVPVRYRTVATLMQYDLEGLQERSLDEISRKMSDVERRLNLGRAGQRVQKREDEIIMTLDEIIKKIEDQQGGGGGGAGGEANRSTAPASDSVIKGSTAPGQVDPKKLDRQGAWGDLPPRARTRAKELISREFPAHYRTAIEEFTRKGANRPANSRK